MKNQFNISEANIANLTSLWKKVSAPFGGCYVYSDFEYCVVQNSEWPNKMWATKNITEPILDEMILRIKELPVVLTVPYWNIFDSDNHKLFETTGFELKLEQVGMSIELDSIYDYTSSLKVQRVQNENDAKVWEEIYPLSFGYKMSKEVVLNSCSEIEFYLFYLDDKPVGTSILYKTDNIVGIHGVGVVPDARRKGLANEILYFLLNRSFQQGVRNVVLQASPMGKGLYDKLGFKEDFRMKNYTLSNK